MIDKCALQYWAIYAALMTNVIYSLYGIGFSNGVMFGVYVGSVVLFCSGSLVRMRIWRSPLFKVVVAFFLAASLSLFLQKLYNGSMKDLNRVDTYEYAVNNLYLTVVYFVFGFAISLPKRMIGQKHLYIGLMILVVVLLPLGGGVIDYVYLSEVNDKDVNQMHVSLSVLVVLYLLYAYSLGLFKPLVIIVAFYVLIIVGSRTALYIGAVSFLVTFLSRKTSSRRMMIILLLLVAFLVVTLVMSNIRVDEHVSRMFFFGGIENDSSGLSRIYQLYEGVAALPNYIIIGDMNFVAEHFGGVGFYIHNILGYWQEYGFFVFLLMGVLLAMNAHCVKKELAVSRSILLPAPQFRILVSMFAITASLVSMSYTFKWIWFAFGMYVSVESYGKSLNQCGVNDSTTTTSICKTVVI